MADNLNMGTNFIHARIDEDKKLLEFYVFGDFSVRD